jgi:two-component system, chemotaxis family, response regulator Rcp1
MNPRILVIEDNPGDVELLRYGLDQQGSNYDLFLLPDGEAALRFVAKQRSGDTSDDPCAIVLDLHLPRHSGMEVLQAVRQEPALAHIEIIILTSVASPAEEAEIRRSGAHYRRKPTQLDEFEELAAFILQICSRAYGVSG